jgi:hypothetical protein
MHRVPVALLALILPLLVTSATPAAHASQPGKEQWQADVRQAMRGSIDYLDARVPRGGGRLAIVLDIDNTSLATEYDWPQPVRPTLRFARHGHRLGVGVFFVTGRYSDHLGGARRALKRAGYPITGMCGRRHGEAIAHGKQRCRRQITRGGWHVIANVGNRRTDFVGANYERAFKLPSYGGRLS